MLQFDRNGDGRIGRDEITEHFTLPFRPELPPENPGFGLPLPSDPAKRKESQKKVFDWGDKNEADPAGNSLGKCEVALDDSADKL